MRAMSNRTRSLCFVALAVAIGVALSDWGRSSREVLTAGTLDVEAVDDRQPARLEPPEPHSVSAERTAVEQDVVAQPAAVASVALPETTGPPDSLVFWCRLLEEGTGVPIVGARLEKYTGRVYSQGRYVVAPFEEESNVQGLVKLDLRIEETPSPSWPPSKTVYVARVDALGFSPGLITVTAGHETPERALEIHLGRSASLIVQIVDASGSPIPSARVSLQVHAYEISRPEGSPIFGEEIDWTGDTDEFGFCTIDDLPSEVPLATSAWSRIERIHREPTPLILKPGERRELKWIIGAGVDLSGWLLDQHDKPVANRRVWLTRSALNARAGRKRFYFYSGDKDVIVAQIDTDQHGRFGFRDVAPGQWFVGPSPVPVTGPLANWKDVAPVATAVDVPAGATQHDIRLRVQRGLLISGTVSTPNGDEPEIAFVRVSSELGHRDARYGNGKFYSGPLAQVEHNFSAGTRGMFTRSESVTAWPGVDDIHLQLGIGGTVSGRVLDAHTGKECAAAVTTSKRGTNRFRLGMQPKLGFSADGLEPGLYDFAAWTTDGRVGLLRDVRLDRGQALEELEVFVQPGSRLRVRYSGPETFANYHVYSDGALVAANGLQTGTSELQRVPAGQLTIRLSIGTETQEERTVECTLGEEKEVVFEL